MPPVITPWCHIPEHLFDSIVWAGRTWASPLIERREAAVRWPQRRKGIP